MIEEDDAQLALGSIKVEKKTFLKQNDEGTEHSPRGGQKLKGWGESQHPQKSNIDDPAGEKSISAGQSQSQRKLKKSPQKTWAKTASLKGDTPGAIPDNGIRLVGGWGERKQSPKDFAFRFSTMLPLKKWTLKEEKKSEACQVRLKEGASTAPPEACVEGGKGAGGGIAEKDRVAYPGEGLRALKAGTAEKVFDF